MPGAPAEWTAANAPGGQAYLLLLLLPSLLGRVRVAQGHEELVTQLLGRGLQASAQDLHKDTPLALAAMRGHADVSAHGRLVLQRGHASREVTPSASQRSQHVTALTVRAVRPLQVAKELLASTESQPGGKVQAVTLPNADGKTVFHLALGGGCGPKAQVRGTLHRRLPCQPPVRPGVLGAVEAKPSL